MTSTRVESRTSECKTRMLPLRPSARYSMLLMLFNQEGLDEWVMLHIGKIISKCYIRIIPVRTLGGGERLDSRPGRFTHG
jgi:hypothetical protein